MENKNEGIRVYAHFDNVRNIYADKKNVRIKGDYYYTNKCPFERPFERIECIIHLDKRLFFKILKEWVKQKSDYYKRYDHYCGYGDVYFEKAIEREKMATDGYDEFDEPIFVKSFTCGKTYKIDMEHG